MARLTGSAMMAVLAGAAVAQEPCGLCATAIVTNSSLAHCFLQRYDALAITANGAIAIDLSDCETDRGIVASLPQAGNAAAMVPDTQFLVSPRQLSCLKGKLEAPGLALDPSARISLDDCQ